MTSPESIDRTRSYLSRVLKLNPVHEADRIIRLRNRYLKIPTQKSPTVAGDSLLKQREQATRAIARVRDAFWQADLQKLRKTLSEMQLDQFPDLKQAAKRLRVVAEERHLFGQLAAKQGFDASFFNAFRSVLVAAPRDASEQRDRVYASIRDNEKLKRCRKMAKLIRSQLPQSYEIESDWLSSIERIKRVKVKQNNSGSGESVSFSGGSGSWGCLGWYLLFAILRALTMISDGP